MRILILVLSLAIGFVACQDVINGTDTSSTEAPRPPSASQIVKSPELKMDIKSITALTLRAGVYASRTAGSSQRLQVKCISGCERIGTPSTVRCTNVGWSGTSVQWDCKTNLPKGSQMDGVRVLCEGFDGPQDTQYIVKDSCGVEFSITGGKNGGGGHKPPSRQPKESKNLLQYIIPIIMVCLVVVILCTLVKACSRSGQNSGGVVMGPPVDQGAPGGGFYGGPTAYPPQPGFNPSAYQGGAPPYAPPGYPVAMGAPVQQQAGGGGSRLGAGIGGFAAGAATGGLLGYMMGNRGSDDHHHHYGGGGGEYGGYGNGGGFGGGDDGGTEMVTGFGDTGME